jgi:Uma2 family endonuclease
MTLEEFLKRPGIDEHPYQEFIDGRIEEKVSLQGKHGRIAARLAARLEAFAASKKLGAVLVEVRCNFGGRSVLPDVAFFRKENIPLDEHGEIPDEILRPADLHVEILSPGQSAAKERSKIRHCLTHGCSMGLLINPRTKLVEVFEKRKKPRVLRSGDVLEGDPVMPGFRLTVDEIFRWLKLDV